MAHLWTPKSATTPPPNEWLYLQLCRDVYHCTPSQLDREDWDTIATHIALLEAEGEVQAAKQKVQADKARARGRR